MVHSPNRALSRRSRHDALAAYVLAHGAATVAELVEQFGVSTMTVHRDLDEPSYGRVWRRSRSATTPTTPEAQRIQPPSRDKRCWPTFRW
ncbi:MAG TPA: DeoR family transcriptional regulator [Mycobacteriales bacterium]|nr:DeoR family transcriptional regulator [Mycobacteriales bacterium]